METIAAISTAQGIGGIAVIRISGKSALKIARAMFSFRGEVQPNLLLPGKIDCGDFSDYGMCVYFRAPHSFTGEDVVEFHCHGGREIARGVLQRAISLGARPACAGEFSKRAFLNGKLSLSAIEGLGDMINASSKAQVRAGYLLYGEKLTGISKRLQERIKECLAQVDADVDFPEEDLSLDARGVVTLETKKISEELNALLKQYRAGKKIKSGVSVAICGRPNAGKSSLLNALLGYERAIVSSIPGTTRDLVDGSLEIGGILFQLFDTAGLRESADEIEREGIRRARNAVLGADVIVYLKEEGDDFQFPDVPVITVHAKSDLKKSDLKKNAGEREDGALSVSSLTGEGIDTLKELLYEKGFGHENDEAFLMEERHFHALARARESVERAGEAASAGLPSELYAEDLKAAYSALGEISGETALEKVIEEIFSKFCVGK